MVASSRVRTKRPPMSSGQFQAGSTKAARAIDGINTRGEEDMFCGSVTSSQLRGGASTSGGDI
jgi:hypothetical protein